MAHAHDVGEADAPLTPATSSHSLNTSLKETNGVDWSIVKSASFIYTIGLPSGGWMTCIAVSVIMSDTLYPKTPERD